MLRCAQHDNSHLYIRSMRKISADYIFPVSSAPIKNGVVVVDDEGRILEITPPPTPSRGGYPAEVEVHEGIIVPGFVNTHCHLELSHLKGELSRQKGLTGFISELIPKRGAFSEEQIKAAIVSADEEMWRNGIVAVGDISNTDNSFFQKKKSKIAYHTFIEIFDLVSERAEKVFEDAKRLTSTINPVRTAQPGGHQPSTLSPHSPYTVSGKLMELIDSQKPSILSIHNQETILENELFSFGTGALAELMKNAGVDVDLKRRAKSSALFIMSYLLEAEKILLVHNTYTSKQDLDIIRSYTAASGHEAVLCLCPRANLYIENRLPDIPMFLAEGMKITIGTDSLASNDSLSILDELKTISKHYPAISFETLIIWATKNGAEFLGMEKQLGTIEKGKKPGLNLISGVSSDKMQLLGSSKVQKLV